MLNLLQIFILISAIPIGIFCAYLTNYEREIYKKYFSPILWILAIVSAIYLIVDIKIALTTISIFIMILTWKISTRWFKKE